VTDPSVRIRELLGLILDMEAHAVSRTGRIDVFPKHIDKKIDEARTELLEYRK
jgi:hypothetical protein